MQKHTILYDTVVHRWLRTPYTLHTTEFRSPKNSTETLVFIHGMGDSAEVWRKVVTLLPDTIRIIGIDMLGFGQSPKPSWVTYNLKIQAKSIAHTLIGLGLRQRPILVGHSMGSLVAIELAKKVPLLLKQLVLCSPPLYRSSLNEWAGREKMLKDFYKLVVKHPSKLEKIAPLALKLGITTEAFNVKGESAKVYVAALESSIMHQSSLDDIQRLAMPITILYGTLDPVVIGSYLKQLGTTRNNIVVKRFAVGHEIVGPYIKHIASELNGILSDTSRFL